MIKLDINDIDSFNNHPFKVEVDDTLKELMESINNNGLINPIIVREKDKGIYGILYAGCISDGLCFIVATIIIGSEYVKLGSNKDSVDEVEVVSKDDKYSGKHIVITISREYASGGRYVGKLLSEKLGINFYDKELISLAAKESGLSKKFVANSDEGKRKTENDDRLFIAETKVIKDLAKNESCVIVGRCADYILKDNKDALKVFLYSDDVSKIKRAVKYYGLNEDSALKEINKINKNREKHYKFYTERNWKDINNYDVMINVDKYGVEETATYIEMLVKDE